MHVALDTHCDVAVSVGDLAPDQMDTHHNRYRCLLCDSQLKVNVSDDGQPDRFFHCNSESNCVADGNTSACHRSAQEFAVMKLYNLLPDGSELAEVDLERRIGDASDFVIVDAVSKPARVAVEIIYKNRNISLKRRLQTLFDEGYGVMLIVVKNSGVNPDRLEHYLKQLGPIRVGRLDPTTWKMSLGSLIKRDTVSLDAPAWDRMPAYLS
ncbi:hypothetical protein [Halorubrum tibetense]|uniref:Uncharacterized protein n=1 Tax=Halorubrum tibetense TaxID=175631 RepID=A0ABD5S982_9EURY